MWIEALSVAGMGFIHGLRHALEPDHLAAVTAMLATERAPRRTLRYAALWGCGHALVLATVGTSLFLLHLRLPEGLSRAFEVAVAVALVLLGLRAWRSLLPRPPESAYCTNAGSAAASATPTRLPIAMGMLHGFAGSGALGALMIGSPSNPITGVVAITVYAVGSLIGMAALAGAFGRPLQHLTESLRLRSAVTFVSGLWSVVVGIMWGITQLKT